MSDFKDEFQDSPSNDEPSNQHEGAGLSRRGVLNIGISAGLAVMLDSLLAGCKTRGFNTSSKGSSATPTFDRENMAQAMLIGTFMERWNDIGAPGFEDRYPSVKLKVHAQILKAIEFEHDLDIIKGEKLQAALRTFLVLFRTRANPLALQDELLKEGVDIVYPGGKGACMVLSHDLVTNVVLNPQNRANQVMENGIGPSGQPEPRKSLVFQLGAYRPEMTNLTRHYILCDDDIQRHDDEKAYQHTHGIKATDAGLVAKICKTAADELVAKAMAKGGDTIDIVQDVARWIPMKVVNSYFGVPCGDAAPEIQLENNAIPLYQGLSYQKGGVHYIKVSEETMYMWIANGFRSLFLNLGKDPVLRDAGRRSGAQLMYYIYLNVRAAANRPQEDTMLSRLAHKMKDPANPYLRGTRSGNTKILEQLKPIEKLEADGAENALFGLCTDVVAYRTAAQLAGSVAGAGVTIEEAIARVFAVLLDPNNKVHLDACIDIAKAGGDFRDYYSKLFPYYNEALRFQPQAELLPRTVAKKAKAKLFARKALTAKPGFTTNEEIELPGGTLTLACIYAAMHDSTVVENPSSFKIGRPGNQYLHFGWAHPANDDHEPKYEGQANRPVSHQGNACLGRFIAPVEIVEAMRAVFAQAGAGIGFADDAKLTFQKFPPMRPGDSTFKLSEFTFDRTNADEMKTGPGAYPAGLRVKLK